MPATQRSIKGWKIAYSADLDVFPVDPRIASVVADAVRAFEEAGAHVEAVKLGIRHSQRELSDVWSRLMMPLNLGTFEAVKAAGLDLLANHRDDFPPEYLHWIEVGQKMTITDLLRDQAIRSEVYDAIQRRFAQLRSDRHARRWPPCRCKTATTATRSAPAR